MYHAHFTYICMEIMPYFDPRASCSGASYTYIMNISYKYDLSSTRGKLPCLLEMTLRGATTCQRQPFLMHSFRYFSNKKVEIAVFCLGYQTRSMVEAQKSPLHVSFFGIGMSIVSFFGFGLGWVGLGTKAFSKTINKHVRQYFSTSSLIARPVNGCLVVKQTILAVKYRCL